MLAGDSPATGDNRGLRCIHPYPGRLIMPQIAISPGTISNIGGQSGGLFGFGGGIGSSTVSGIGGAVSDFFAAQGYKYKAKGAEIEAQQYRLAAGFADLNAQYSKESTALKAWQVARKANLTLGEAAADVAANNFQLS